MAKEDDKACLSQEGCQLGLRDGQDWTCLTNFSFEIECFVGDRRRAVDCPRICIHVKLENNKTYPVFMEQEGKNDFFFIYFKRTNNEKIFK